jgi:hypothetical protein
MAVAGGEHGDRAGALLEIVHERRVDRARQARHRRHELVDRAGGGVALTGADRRGDVVELGVEAVGLIA